MGTWFKMLRLNLILSSTSSSITLVQAAVNLELTAVFWVYRHFLPFLKYSHALVRTDSTVGRTRSVTLHRLTYSLIMWSSKDLPSLGTTHFLVHRPGKWESPQRGGGLRGLGKGNQLCILDSSHEGSLCPITEWYTD